MSNVYYQCQCLTAMPGVYWLGLCEGLHTNGLGQWAGTVGHIGMVRRMLYLFILFVTLYRVLYCTQLSNLLFCIIH